MATLPPAQVFKPRRVQLPIAMLALLFDLVNVQHPIKMFAQPVVMQEPAQVPMAMF
jgi:uncharacterized membrane protein